MLQKYLLAFVFGGLVIGGVVYFTVGHRSAPPSAPAANQMEPAGAAPAAPAAAPEAAPAQPVPVAPQPSRTARRHESAPRQPELTEPVPSAPQSTQPVEVAQAQPQPPPQPEVPPQPVPAAQPSPALDAKPQLAPDAQPSPAPDAKPRPAPDAQPQPAQDLQPQTPVPPPAALKPRPSNVMRPDPLAENRDHTPHTVTIPAGTTLAVRLRDAISTDKQSEGDPFTATLDQSVVIDGFVIAERGALVQGKIASLTAARRGASHAAIALELTELNTTDGQKVDIRTDSSRKTAASDTKGNVTKLGVGAVLGTIIGAAAGGGKGAAIGAGAGTAAGGGAALGSKGQEVRLPSETLLSFKLAEAVTLTEKLK